MKKVLLITTGGTLSCKEGKEGLRPSLRGRDIVKQVPELKTLCDIAVEDVFCIDSSNLQPEHWQILAEVVGNFYEDYDGFVITMGTDTLAFAAAALSHMLVNLGKPVVITGAMVPLVAANSDARTNLQLAFSMAVGNLPGVYVAFGNKVIRGYCAKKIFTKNANAFESVNESPVLCFTKEGLKKNLGVPQPQGAFAVHKDLETRVMAITVTPGLRPDVIDAAVAAGYKGIVLECFGSGGVNCSDNNLVPALRQAIKHGVRVVIISQCLFEGTDLNSYPMGRALMAAGAEDGGIATLENALTGLMWSLKN